MKAELIRKYGEKQTLGWLTVMDDNDKPIMSKLTLELPWKDNKRNISCIPEGVYWVKKRKASESPTKKYDHFIIENVPNRSYCLWHGGNYNTQIQGCILIGAEHKDLNSDGLLDIADTLHTIAKLYALLPDRFRFVVRS